MKDFLKLLKRLASTAIIQDVTVNSNGDDVHPRYIDVDKFIEAIDAELLEIPPSLPPRVTP